MKHSYIIILTVLLSSCGMFEKEQDDNIIPKDKMVEIIVDAQFVESALKVHKRKREDMVAYTDHYYNYIFEKHNITKEEFEESLEYYSENIAELDRIYADVINILSRKLSETKNE